MTKKVIQVDKKKNMSLSEINKELLDISDALKECAELGKDYPLCEIGIKDTIQLVGESINRLVDEHAKLSVFYQIWNTSPELRKQMEQDWFDKEETKSPS